MPLLLTSYTLTCALGAGCAPMLSALRSRHSGLQRIHWETADIDTCLGIVASLDDMSLRADLTRFDCRNNRLAQWALEQDGFADAVYAAVKRYSEARIGVFLGTSNSGVLSTELAYRRRHPQTGELPADLDYRHTHNTYSVADFVRSYFALTGPAWVVSTACSSSAKVFGSAQRMISSGLIDAAIVGGVDSLCLTTLYGFNSLQLVSRNACLPFDAHRDGISLGEGAAFILLEGRAAHKGDVVLSGVGESSDAYHMSSPHPQGLGAAMAMRAALNQAGLSVAEIDYINLHGTATPSNDAAEAAALTDLAAESIPCSSTKGHTGHTLGAAGAVEAVICALALIHDFVPAGAGTQQLDPQFACNYVLANRAQPMRHVLSNSFGFGGSNCSLVFSKAAA